MLARLRPYGPDLGITCASLIAAASLTRLIAGGLGGMAAGPLLGAAAAGAVLPAALSVRHVAIPVRMLTGTVAVALVALWATSPGSTKFGIPTTRTWHVLQAQLQSAHPILVAFTLPLPATQGTILLCALLAGLIAVLAAVTLHAGDRSGQLYPGLALLFPFGLLALVCAQTASASVALPVGAMVIVAVATVSVAQPAPIRAGAGRVGAAWRSATVVLTVVTVIGATSLALSLGSGGAGGEPSLRPVPATELSLTSSLVTVEVHDANEVMFRARSPYPTYWQVAVLNTLRDGVWVPGPGAGPAGGGAGTSPVFTASVDIATLSSRILPVPPATVSFAGLRGAVFTQEGVQSTRRTSTGQHYSATAVVPFTHLNLPSANAPVSTFPPALVATETALPALSPSIAALARQATVGAITPLGEAAALVNWFRSGRFRYTLHPPAGESLVRFLTRTRAGTCEQFAGAFTVLARSLGLPTRLVVGFTGGTRTGAQEVTVRGDDAHAWPEVYLGAQAGWVSFEPTPQQQSAGVAPEGVIGPTVAPTSPPPRPVSPPTTTPTTTPTPTSVAPTTVPTTTPRGVSPTTTPTSAPAAVPPRHGSYVWLFLPLGGLVFVVAAMLAVVFRRRRSAANREPLEMSLHAEATVDRALQRAGAARPPWEPLTKFVAELADRAATSPSAWLHASQSADQLHAALDDAARVARLAERARYGPGPVDGDGARAAHVAATRVRHGLRNGHVRRLLLDARLEEDTGRSAERSTPAAPG
jgi:transglutaminase-like putative cysteine protease